MPEFKKKNIWCNIRKPSYYLSFLQTHHQRTRPTSGNRVPSRTHLTFKILLSQFKANLTTLSASREPLKACSNLPRILVPLFVLDPLSQGVGPLKVRPRCFLGLNSVFVSIRQRLGWILLEDSSGIFLEDSSGIFLDHNTWLPTIAA